MRWVILIALVAACDGGGTGTGGDAAPDAAPPDADPYCHWDCFGYTECADGVVTAWEDIPVPCEYWTGECPSSTFTCERGCRTDVDQLGPLDPPLNICEENRPKAVGDPCVDDSYCRPEVATIHPDGSVTNVYLQCDTTAGQCVERTPPTVADLYAPCGLHADPTNGIAFGSIETAACSAGVCAYYEDETQTCMWQMCTTHCASDGECPVGTTCVDTVCKPPEVRHDPVTCQP